MLWRGLTQVTHIKLSLLSRQQHKHVSYGLLRCSRSPSPLLVVVPLSTFLVHSTLGILLHNCFSSYSNSYELVTVIIAVIC
ncbi:unnamed protein product [Hymenolepis diminuta]|uniref:Uncharacterized protein n=1 Tax=Hymenolepis diminuta TaxID=6216 RepID=A0A564Y476_HYMDI|nr:unnamed protein product [Hymenolepis diminuta]